MGIPGTVKGYSGYRVKENGVLESRRRGDWEPLRGHRRKRGGHVGYRLRADSGGYRSWYLHAFVMMAFRGPTPEGKEVCFRNGERDDCRLENLYFGKADRRRNGVAT